jgi:hypothetical protein
VYAVLYMLGVRYAVYAVLYLEEVHVFPRLRQVLALASNDADLEYGGRVA